MQAVLFENCEQNLRYKVKVQQSALTDVEEFVTYIRDQNQEPANAAKWFDGLEEAILSLAELPKSHPEIAEQGSFQIEIRQKLYLSHRIIFHVSDGDQVVHVLRIYHVARDAITPRQVEI
jgi:plasmid stabilization system protein ParE